MIAKFLPIPILLVGNLVLHLRRQAASLFAMLAVMRTLAIAFVMYFCDWPLAELLIFLMLPD